MRTVIVNGQEMTKETVGQFQVVCGCARTLWVRQGKRGTCPCCGSRMTRTGLRRLAAELTPVALKQS